jgi:predicted RNase H-like nuclease (RuvC/YqgF family)
MSHSLSDLLLRYAQQFEDQHAPQNMTIALREAAKEITALRAESERLATELHIATEWSAQVHAGQQEDADTITALRAEVERLKAIEADYDDHEREMIDLEEEVVRQAATIERLRLALEEIAKPGGADDFWQCVDIARAAIKEPRT